MESHERFVDRAVIATVEHQDFRPTGDGARHTQRKAIRIGRGGGDLPVWQAKALDQQATHRDGVRGRQHVRQAFAGLALDRRDDGRRRMSEHRAGVAEAEIRVFVTVDVTQRGAACATPRATGTASTSRASSASARRRKSPRCRPAANARTEGGRPHTRSLGREHGFDAPERNAAWSSCIQDSARMSPVSRIVRARAASNGRSAMNGPS